MITLYRMIRLWQLRIKYKLVFYTFLDITLKDIVNNPEEMQKKLIHAFAEVVHNSNTGE